MKKVKQRHMLSLCTAWQGIVSLSIVAQNSDKFEYTNLTGHWNSTQHHALFKQWKDKLHSFHHASAVFWVLHCIFEIYKDQKKKKKKKKREKKRHVTKDLGLFLLYVLFY